MIAHIIPLKRTPLTLPHFDYLVPVDLEGQLKVGQLVVVPFRSHQAYGIVKEIAEVSATKIALKSIESIVCPAPLISPDHLQFLIELSELYHTSLGFITKSNLPELPKKMAIEKPPLIKKINSFNKPTLTIYQNSTERNELIIKLAGASHGQTLILVPEIDDIKNITEAFSTFEQKNIAIVNSNLKTKEYRETWFDIWRGDKKIIIGTRQALFLSFHNLEHIIVENEGHPSHKSWDMAPRFHTRDAGMMLAKHEGAKLTILTHTPTVESYYFAIKGIYETDENPLPKKPLIKYHLIDAAGERIGKNFERLSNEVQDFIEHSNGLIFLFLNKLGTSGYSACRDCGLVFACNSCKRTYNYSEKRRILRCNWCKVEIPLPLSCPKCNSTSIFLAGSGVEHLEKNLKARFKNRPIIRLDSESGVKKITTIPENAIIVGTQHAWTRIPWSKLQAVVFVDADAPLFSPEYKSTENLWQQLHDALAKLSPTSELFIQTKHLDNAIFDGFDKPAKWYDQELLNRKTFNYPPHSFIIKLFSSAPRTAAIQAEASRLYKAICSLTKTDKDITITPNLEAFPYFQKGAFWQVIIVKVSYKNYKQMTRAIMKLVPENWKVDLNPNTLLSL